MIGLAVTHPPRHSSSFMFCVSIIALQPLLYPNMQIIGILPQINFPDAVMSPRIYVASYSLSLSLKPSSLPACLVSLLRLSMGYGPQYNRQYFNADHWASLRRSYESPKKDSLLLIVRTFGFNSQLQGSLSARSQVQYCNFFFLNKNNVRVLLVGTPMIFLSLFKKAFLLWVLSRR